MGPEQLSKHMAPASKDEHSALLVHVLVHALATPAQPPSPAKRLTSMHTSPAWQFSSVEQ